jgi:hypothetical protein
MIFSKKLGVLSLIVFIAAIMSFILVFNSTKTLFNVISGYATSTGEANLTIETVVAVNFTNAHINWGSGRVAAGFQNATLDTNVGTVTNGNWTTVSQGLVLENIGNLNVTLNITGAKTAAQLLGGTNPFYGWLFSLEGGSSVDTCLNSGGSQLVFAGEYQDVQTAPYELCRFFGFRNSKDSLLIDFQLRVPSDSFTGALGDTITATAFAAPY